MSELDEEMNYFLKNYGLFEEFFENVRKMIYVTFLI